MRYVTIGMVAMLAVCFGPRPAAAQGLFVRLDLGLGLAKSVLESGGETMSLGADGSIARHPGTPFSESGPGFHAGAAVGYDWGKTRVEGEYFRRSTPHAGGVHATFANLLYELPVTRSWKTFLGAGAGVQWSGAGVAQHSAPSLPAANGGLPVGADFAPAVESDEAGAGFVPGYQLVAGVERALRESVSLGARVRWAQFGESALPESRGWGVSVVLRYGF